MAKKATTKKTTTTRAATPKQEEPASTDATPDAPDATASATPEAPATTPPAAEDTGLKVAGATVFVSRFRSLRMKVGNKMIIFENGRAVVRDKALAEAAMKTKQFGTEFSLA